MNGLTWPSGIWAMRSGSTELPDEAEEDAVEAALGIGIPTREDMQEIEVSSRIYREAGALFLTAQVVASHEARETISAR